MELSFFAFSLEKHDYNEIKRQVNTMENIYTVASTSSSTTYGNIMTFVKDMITQKFSVNFFKDINLASEISYVNIRRRLGRNTLKEMSKLERPFMNINPQIQPPNSDLYLFDIPLTKNFDNMEYGIQKNTLFDIVKNKDDINAKEYLLPEMVMKMCKEKNLPFRIYCQTPNLTDHLVPNKYNWIIDKEELSFDTKECYPCSILTYHKLNSWLQTVAQRVMLKWCLSKKHKQIHVYTNMLTGEDEFCLLYNELFKPSNDLQKQIDSAKK